jgi:intein/homing endonuclease
LKRLEIIHLRLRDAVKSELIHRIQSGDSINKISRDLSLAKSTIYHHYKQMFGRKSVLPSFTPRYTKVEGEIVGIFAGDGNSYVDHERHSYRISIYFGNKNKTYMEYVKTLLDNYFNKEFKVAKATDCAMKVHTTSKKILYFFQRYLEYNPHTKHSTVKIKSLKVPDTFLNGFIKGFLDTDGWISQARDRPEPRIGFSTTSKKLATQINDILHHFKIKCGLYTINRDHKGEKTIYNIQIWKRSTDTFLNKIKPFKVNKLKGL